MMKPKDIVMFRGEFGRTFFWEVRGVFLGAEGQESLVELLAINERPGHAYSKIQETTFVPEPLLRTATIFTPEPA